MLLQLILLITLPIRSIQITPSEPVIETSLNQLRVVASQILSSTVLSNQDKLFVFQRFIIQNNLDGCQNYLSLVNLQQQQQQLQQLQQASSCTFPFSFSVDHQEYQIDVNGLKPNANKISQEIQQKFNQVKGLQSILYESIVQTLRSKSQKCAESKSEYMHTFKNYCNCMYSHLSSRNILTQPSVIGMCPVTAIQSDFKVTNEILSIQESNKIILWAIDQRNKNTNVGGALDSVDSLPSFTYDLNNQPFHTLAYIIGVELNDFKERIRQQVINVFSTLDIAFNDPRFQVNSWYDNLFDSDKRKDVYIFVREYDPLGRDGLHWHRDACSYSLNLSLNDDYRGGNLELFLDAKVQVANSRNIVGRGIVFGPNVAHRVAKVTRGTRWSLVIFIDKRKDEEFLPCFVDFSLQI